MSALQTWSDPHEMLQALAPTVRVFEDGVEILDESGFRGGTIDDLIVNAVFADDPVRSVARWVIRQAAPRLGAFPASIHELYMAAGRGEYDHTTAPAINVRGLSYDAMRAIFRAAQANDSKIMLFELARSEMGYTEQRPGEFASNVLAAAIKERHAGPVFIQGDHYQVNAKRYAADPEAELQALRDLTAEAIAAGYFNIDIDASTIVDLSLKTLDEQQQLNGQITAEFTRFIREHQPEGITVSIGGEIGEVGLRNSTVEDLHAFMGQYQAELERQADDLGRGLTGISKISVQTGTSHGGIVLPDGSIQEVSVDFDTLAALSQDARNHYGMGGAVQHGASTLPESFFGHFAQADAVEVHLATAFQNVQMDSPSLPAAMRDELNAYIDANYADERKPDQTDVQFRYGARKRAWGPLKRQFWSIDQSARDAIAGELEAMYSLIMGKLGVAGSAALVDRIITRVEPVVPPPPALAAALRGEKVAAGGAREVYDQVEGE